MGSYVGLGKPPAELLLVEEAEADHLRAEIEDRLDALVRKAHIDLALCQSQGERTALYRFLARTPSRLVALALTDAVGDRRTQNQPGTTDEYPNWRVPLADPDGRLLLLEDVFTDARAAALCEVLRAELTG